MQIRYVFRKWTPDEVSLITNGKVKDYLFCWSLDENYQLDKTSHDQLDKIALLYLDNQYIAYDELSKSLKIKISDSYNDWDDPIISSILGIKIVNRYKSPNTLLVKDQHSDIKDTIYEETEYNSYTLSIDSIKDELQQFEDIQLEELPLEEICPIENLDRNSFSNEEFVFNEGKYSQKLITIMSLLSIVTNKNTNLLKELSQDEYIKRFKSGKSTFYDFTSNTLHEDGFVLSTISFVLINNYNDFIDAPAREFICEKLEPKERIVIDRLIKLNFIYEQNNKINNDAKFSVIKEESIPQNKHNTISSIIQSKYISTEELNNNKMNQLVEENMELLSDQLSNLVNWRNNILDIKTKQHPSADYNIVIGNKSNIKIH